jgi:predicted RNase H-like nuclease (RuvC/YqgF family)
MAKVPLRQQIEAVHRSVVNLRGTINQLKEMLRQKRADPATISMRENHLTELEAALETMEWLEKNRDWLLKK